MLVGDLDESQRFSVNGDPLPLDWPAIPCGLQAKSSFNDKFELYSNLMVKNQNAKPIVMNEKDIAWASDVKYKYKNIKDIPDGMVNKETGKAPKDWKDIQWMDMEDEHFIAWMRTSGLPSFRKLYGKFDNGLKAGNYIVRIDNKFNVKPFNGMKSVVLTTTTSWGGKFNMLANAFTALGVFCIVFEIIFMIVLRKRRSQPHERQD